MPSSFAEATEDRPPILLSNRTGLAMTCETDPPPKHVLRYLAATHCVHEFMPRKIEAALSAEALSELERVKAERLQDRGSVKSSAHNSASRSDCRKR